MAYILQIPSSEKLVLVIESEMQIEELLETHEGFKAFLLDKSQFVFTVRDPVEQQFRKNSAGEIVRATPVQVVPVDPDGKVILILEEEKDAESMKATLEQVNDFMNDPYHKVALLFGAPIKLVKASDLKEIRTEEKK